MVNVPDDANQIPLHCAIRKGHKDVVQLLLENGASPQPMLLQIAAASNHADVVDVLLVHQKELLVADEQAETTALTVAAAKGYLDVVEVLIHHGARIEYAFEERYYSPLHVASILGRSEIARLLLTKGAEVDIPCKTNITPLQYAASKGRNDVIILLLEHKADITKMVLHQAVSSKTLSTVELVLQKLKEIQSDHFDELINTWDAKKKHIADVRSRERINRHC